MATSELVNALPPILDGNDPGGLQSNILAADLISMDAKFNLWFIEFAKRKLSEDELLGILEESYDGQKKCLIGISDFGKTGNHEVFHALLLSTANQMKQIISRYENKSLY